MIKGNTAGSKGTCNLTVPIANLYFELEFDGRGIESDENWV
jgi:hypothetical protein